MMDTFSSHQCINILQQMILQSKTVDHSYIGTSKAQKNQLGPKAFWGSIAILLRPMSCPTIIARAHATL